MKEEFEVIFPPLNGDQPKIIDKKILDKDLWEKFKEQKDDYNLPF